VEEELGPTTAVLVVCGVVVELEVVVLSAGVAVVDVVLDPGRSATIRGWAWLSSW
jgi:hypothetical protein